MVHDHAIVTLPAALIAGLAGSAHCFGMCGGVAGALGMRASHEAKTPAGAVLNTLLHQFGRIGGYAVAGAAIGAFGQVIQAVLDLARIGTALRVASGVLLLLIAARLALRWNGLAILERYGASFWLKIRPLAMREARGGGARSALTVGFLWGWLPCGLVYSMLLLAATSGTALQGAAIMAAFGIGTLPSLLASSAFASQLQRMISTGWSRLASAMLLAAFGVWTIAAPLYPHAQHVH